MSELISIFSFLNPSLAAGSVALAEFARSLATLLWRRVLHAEDIGVGVARAISVELTDGRVLDTSHRTARDDYRVFTVDPDKTPQAIVSDELRNVMRHIPPQHIADVIKDRPRGTRRRSARQRRPCGIPRP